MSDFLKYFAKYKTKGEGQFPPPEYIYKKKLAFLNATLISIQEGRKEGDTKNTESNKNPDHTKKEEEIAKTLQKNNKTSSSQLKPDIQKSKLGVTLCEKTKKHSKDSSISSSDDSIIIPENIQEIIDDCFSSKDKILHSSASQEDILYQIEASSFSKKEAEIYNKKLYWVEELLNSDEKRKSRGNNWKKSKIPIYLPASIGPIIPLENSGIKISTPTREKYNEETQISNSVISLEIMNNRSSSVNF